MGNEEHEGIFGHVAIAFMQRDFGLLRQLARSDVVLRLTGTSPLAGTYRGRNAVSGLANTLRRYVTCTPDPIRFAHEEDRMTAHREVAIHGQLHRVDMTLHVSFSFDRSDTISAVLVEPSDPGLFDHVISVEMGDEAGSGSLRIPDLSEDRHVVRSSSAPGNEATPRRRGHI
jgi:hypothetical protein